MAMVAIEILINGEYFYKFYSTLLIELFKSSIKRLAYQDIQI